MDQCCSSPPHRVVMVLYPQVAASDVTGPMEVFGLANFLSGKPHYELLTVTGDGKPVLVAGSYGALSPTHRFETLPTPVGTLLVAGGPTAQAAAADRHLLDWLRRIEPHCQRLGSVCTGAYILAGSGLTRGQLLATHWHEAAELARLHPATTVVADAIFVESGKLWSSAGMSTGVDLALAMIGRDHGRTLAMDVARYLVLHLERSGGQSQFSMHVEAQLADTPKVKRVQQHIIDRPAADLRIEVLARLAAMSTRSLLRHFRESTGQTVGAFVADVRLRHACMLIEKGDKGLKEIAALSGLGTAANMRKVFVRRLGIAPALYRERFARRRRAMPRAAIDPARPRLVEPAKWHRPQRADSPAQTRMSACRAGEDGIGMREGSSA